MSNIRTIVFKFETYNIQRNINIFHEHNISLFKRVHENLDFQNVNIAHVVNIPRSFTLKVTSEWERHGKSRGLTANNYDNLLQGLNMQDLQIQLGFASQSQKLQLHRSWQVRNLCALWQQGIRPSTVHIICLQGGVSHVACRIQVPDRVFSFKVNALQVEKEANQESLIGNRSMLQKSWADGYWNTIY